MKRITTRTLVSLALLSALEVVLARFIVPMPNPTMRFSIEHVPIILAGLLFGPIPGMLVGFVGDFVGTLFSGYGYNPVFAVSPVTVGLCAGLLRALVIRKASFPRILASFLPAVVLFTVIWQSWWLAFLYGTRTFGAFLRFRGIQFTITSLINAAVIFGIFRTRVFETLGFWPPANPDRSPCRFSRHKREVQP